MIHPLGAVLVQDRLQRGEQLLWVDALLAAKRVHLLVQVCHLRTSLDKMAQLFRQVRQQVLQAEGRARLAVAAHCHYFSQLVIQRGVDGADGVFPAKERLTSYKQEEENHLKRDYSDLWCWKRVWLSESQDKK